MDSRSTGAWRGQALQSTIACRHRAGATPISAQAYKTGAYLFLLGMLGTHAFFFWSVRARIAKGDPDFTVFYTAGKIVREGLGGQLYDPGTQARVQREFATDSDIRRGALPYIHPPFEALLFLPLTFLPYRFAFVTWNLVNLGMLAVVAWLLRGSVAWLRGVPVWLFVVISLAFFPVFANFHQGQDAILLLLVVVLSFRALERNALLAAGCWLGLGVFKYHLILPLALILVAWKGRKFALGFVAVALAMVIVSVGIVGWDGAMHYPVYAWRIVSEPAFGGIPARQLPNLLGLVGGWSLPEGWKRLVPFITLVCSAGLLIAAGSLRSAGNERRVSGLMLASAVIAAVLCGYSTNSYDLSLLVLPLVLVLDYCLGELSGSPGARVRLLAPVVPLLISPLWFFLWMRWERLNIIAIFLVCWMVVIMNEVTQRDRLKDVRAGTALA